MSISTHDGSGAQKRMTEKFGAEGRTEVPRLKPMEDFRSLPEQQWRQRLSPEEFRVLRQAGTEAPFVGEYTDTHAEGVYCCRACGAELFRSTEKFDSHCGWPSFFDPARSDAVITREDLSLGMRRLEVLCARCESHLGHVFVGEGYETPTDLRYCINSICLSLRPAGQD